MINSFLTWLCLLLLSPLTYAFDIQSKQNVALYWGQNSAGSQQSLGEYCQSTDADIYLLSFLYQFPTIGLNFASACTTSFGDGTLHCSEIAQDIKTCQSLGKKVFLSLGGASGAYGFSDDNSAKQFAQTLWDTFGEGSGTAERPFDSAIIDGFDLDIENNQPTGYAALVSELRTLFAKGTKKYYISAAPQCVYPDASVGDVLANADVDFAFIQFYNNYCNVDKSFNWDTWLNFAQSVSPNKDIKLYLGLPGSATAASSGYISDLSLLKETIAKISTTANFGGVAMWDASQAFANKIDGQSYVSHIKNILSAGSSDSAGTFASSSSLTFTSSASSSTSSIAVPATTSSSEAKTSTLEPSTPTTTVATNSEAKTTTLAPQDTLQTSVTTSASDSSITSTTSTVKITQTLTSANIKQFSTSSNETPVVTTETSSSATRTTLAPTTTPVTTTTPVATTTPVTTTAPATTTTPATTASPAVTTTATTTQATTSASTAHEQAVSLNTLYSSGKFNGKETCSNGDIACSSTGEFAICNYGSWVTMACAQGTTCFAYDSGEFVSSGCNFSNLKDNFTK